MASEEDPGDAIAPLGAYQHSRAAEVESAAAATTIAAAVAVAKGESVSAAAPGLLQSAGRGFVGAPRAGGRGTRPNNAKINYKRRMKRL